MVRGSCFWIRAGNCENSTRSTIRCTSGCATNRRLFSEVAANWLIERSETADGPGADPGQVRVGMASGNYFSTIGVEAAVGRTFNTLMDNRAPGAHPVAVISHGYWERRFARAADIVGRKLTLAGT